MKTLKLLRYFGQDSAVYFYSNEFSKFRHVFEATGCYVEEGHFGKNLLAHVRALVSMVDDYGADVVQVQFSMGEILGALLKLIRPRLKLVVAFVGSDEPRSVKKIVSNVAYLMADHFVFVSDYVKQAKVTQFPRLASGRSTVIYNGVERRQEEAALLPPLGVKSLVSVGGLTSVKNLDVLLEAIQILVGEIGIDDVYLYLVGDGPERERLENRITQLQLTKYVCLTGYQENVGGFLARCSLYLHPCIAEGFGISVVEAMLEEKPVIVADAGALPELIVNGVSGLVVPPCDARSWAFAIAEVLQSKELSQRIALAGRVRASEIFTIERFVSSYEKVYVSLVSSHH